MFKALREAVPVGGSRVSIPGAGLHSMHIFTLFFLRTLHIFAHYNMRAGKIKL